MKNTIVLLALTFPLFLFGQRGDVPKTNPDNALDLKVVFQEYSVTTYSRYGNTTQSSEYLNLKVNDLYLPGGGTGISAKHFNQYLANCPKALDLSIDGLSMYDKRNKNYRYGNFSMLGGFGAGAFIMLRKGSDIDKASAITGASIVVGGMLTNYLFRRRAQSYKRKGDDMIVNAFDIYAENCFKSELYSAASEETKTATQGADNGENNDKEQVLIDLISNNSDSKFLSFSLLGGVSMLDALGVHVGPELAYYKKGMHFNAYGFATKSIGADIPSNDDFEFGGSASITVPFIKSNSPTKKIYLNLGSLHGMDAVAESETMDVKVYKSFGLDLGAEYYQQNVSQFDPLINDYFVKATSFRGGLSRSLFSEVTYKVDDNRFSEGIRYATALLRFYAHALYNFDTDYQIVPTGFNRDPEVRDDIGYVLGMDLRFAANSKNRAGTVIMEVGKYPLQNSVGGWGGQLKVGYGIYSVDRAKTKSRSRSRSRSRR